MSIEVRDNPEQNRYEIFVGDLVAGFTQYRLEPGIIAFVHTVIDDEYAGQGLAKILATQALDDVRKRELAVLPYCPFIRGFIAKNPAYLDLVPEEVRPEFDLA